MLHVEPEVVSAHCDTASSGPARPRPRSVTEYSTEGGLVGNTVRQDPAAGRLSDPEPHLPPHGAQDLAVARKEMVWSFGVTPTTARPWASTVLAGALRTRV